MIKTIKIYNTNENTEEEEIPSKSKLEIHGQRIPRALNQSRKKTSFQ